MKITIIKLAFGQEKSKVHCHSLAESIRVARDWVDNSLIIEKKSIQALQSGYFIQNIDSERVYKLESNAFYAPSFDKDLPTDKSILENIMKSDTLRFARCVIREREIDITNEFKF